MGDVVNFPIPKGSLAGVIESVSKGEKVVFWWHNCPKQGGRSIKMIRGFVCNACQAQAIGHRLGPYEDRE